MERAGFQMRKPDSETVAVMVGLVCGMVFIVVIAVTLDSFGSHFPNTPSQFLRIAGELPESQEFLSNYPDANTTVYIRDIVEYLYQDESRYAALRISIDRNGGNPTFMQINCIVIGDELNGVEIHGSKLEGITTFFLDKRCPEATFARD